MQQLVLIIHVLVAIALVVLVLIQQGKGAEMGTGFGGGASQTVFGSQGSGSFLMKLTGGLAAVFFATSILLANMASQQQGNRQPLQIQQPAEQTQPAESQQPEQQDSQSADMPVVPPTTDSDS